MGRFIVEFDKDGKREWRLFDVTNRDQVSDDVVQTAGKTVAEDSGGANWRVVENDGRYLP